MFGIQSNYEMASHMSSNSFALKNKNSARKSQELVIVTVNTTFRQQLTESRKANMTDCGCAYPTHVLHGNFRVVLYDWRSQLGRQCNSFLQRVHTKQTNRAGFLQCAVIMPTG